MENRGYQTGTPQKKTAERKNKNLQGMVRLDNNRNKNSNSKKKGTDLQQLNSHSEGEHRLLMKAVGQEKNNSPPERADILNRVS